MGSRRGPLYCLVHGFVHERCCREDIAQSVSVSYDRDHGPAPVHQYILRAPPPDLRQAEDGD